MKPHPFSILSLYPCSVLRSFFLFFAIFTGVSIHAQPHIDLVSIKGSLGPDAGIWRRNNTPVKFKHYVGAVSLPLKFKTDSSTFIFTAATDRWNIRSAGVEDLPNAVQSLLFAATYIKPVSKKWALAASIIPRWNGSAEAMFKNSFQLGGTALAIYKHSAPLSYRFGVYYNSEFFGSFIVPLAGIDWRITAKDNLFGLLPQVLTYEHTINRNFRIGANYRMFNNSYRAGYRGFSMIPNFMRIAEMQLLGYADVYLSKNFVLNMEAGHSLFRRVRMGVDKATTKYYSAEKMNDGFVFKAGLFYRIQLR